jgi:putative cell wall-binding protein
MTNAPVLIAEPTSLPVSVHDEIERLAPSRIYVLGNELALDAHVADALAALPGSPTVTRLGAAGRYNTASLVASEVVALSGKAWDGRVIVATGGDYPDALAASPVAFARRIPVVLAHPDGTPPALPPGTKSAVVLGNELAVSTATFANLQARLGAANVSRLGGAGRYATGAAIAGWASALGLSWDGLALTTGENYPDALTGGAMAGWKVVMIVTWVYECWETGGCPNRAPWDCS